jgi:hypothetical protein
MKGFIFKSEKMNVLNTRYTGIQSYFILYPSLKDELDNNDYIKSEKSETTGSSTEK